MPLKNIKKIQSLNLCEACITKNILAHKKDYMGVTYDSEETIDINLLNS